VEFTSYRDRIVAFATDLVNTSGLTSDELADASALEALMARHNVGWPRAIGAADLEAVKGLRDRLRGVFTAPDERTAAGVLNGLLADADARPFLSNHDGRPWHLHFAPENGPFPSWLAAHTAAGLAIVIAEEGFDRLKICEGARCKDVFVDMSKNRSRRFCSAEVCGNRASVAAYRRRQRERSDREAETKS
jgi:predicted RNA-binding Zn ribbon-like protein